MRVGIGVGVGEVREGGKTDRKIQVMSTFFDFERENVDTYAHMDRRHAIRLVCVCMYVYGVMGSRPSLTLRHLYTGLLASSRNTTKRRKNLSARLIMHNGILKATVTKEIFREGAVKKKLRWT